MGWHSFQLSSPSICACLINTHQIQFKGFHLLAQILVYSGLLQYHDIEHILSTCWVNFQHVIWVPHFWVYFFRTLWRILKKRPSGWQYHRVGSQQSFRRHRQLNNCTLSIVNFSNCFFFPLLLNLFLFIIIIFFLCDWLCVESCFYCFGFSARFFSVGQTKFSLSFFKLHILSVVILKFWC